MQLFEIIRHFPVELTTTLRLVERFRKTHWLCFRFLMHECRLRERGEREEEREREREPPHPIFK
jgi:hypothetical protein